MILCRHSQCLATRSTRSSFKTLSRDQWERTPHRILLSTHFRGKQKPPKSVPIWKWDKILSWSQNVATGLILSGGARLFSQDPVDFLKSQQKHKPWLWLTSNSSEEGEKNPDAHSNKKRKNPFWPHVAKPRTTGCRITRHSPLCTKTWGMQTQLMHHLHHLHQSVCPSFYNILSPPRIHPSSFNFHNQACYKALFHTPLQLIPILHCRALLMVSEQYSWRSLGSSGLPNVALHNTLQASCITQLLKKMYKQHWEQDSEGSLLSFIYNLG